MIESCGVSSTTGAGEDKLCKDCFSQTWYMSHVGIRVLAFF
jgi:hypothetical protein